MVAGGPNLSVGKWLVLRGVDEEKVPKSRAPAAAAPRASARRSAGSGRRARYDWDSDVTSDEDPGVSPTTRVVTVLLTEYLRHTADAVYGEVRTCVG